MSVCDSPQLFAAYRVLLRRLMPWHPPYALYSLNLRLFPLIARQIIFHCFIYCFSIYLISSFKIICFTLCSCQCAMFPRQQAGLYLQLRKPRRPSTLILLARRALKGAKKGITRISPLPRIRPKSRRRKCSLLGNILLYQRYLIL